MGPGAHAVCLLVVQVPGAGDVEVLPALRRIARVEIGSGAFEQIRRLDWHWSQPCWPASRVVVLQVTDSLTVYRCYYCKLEIRNQAVARLHMASIHPGQSARWTIYPPAVGVIPRGGDE